MLIMKTQVLKNQAKKLRLIEIENEKVHKDVREVFLAWRTDIKKRRITSLEAQKPILGRMCSIPFYQRNTEERAEFIKSISDAMNHFKAQKPNLNDSPFNPYKDFNEIECKRLYLPSIEIPLCVFLQINLSSLIHLYENIICEQYALNTLAQENQLTNLFDTLLCSVTIKPLITHDYRMKTERETQMKLFTKHDDPMMTSCETHYRCAVFLSKSEKVPPALFDMHIDDYDSAKSEPAFNNYCLESLNNLKSQRAA